MPAILDLKHLLQFPLKSRRKENLLRNATGERRKKGKVLFLGKNGKVFHLFTHIRLA